MRNLAFLLISSAVLMAADIPAEDLMKRIEAGDMLYRQYFGHSATEAFVSSESDKSEPPKNNANIPNALDRTLLKKEPTLFIFSSSSVPIITINNYLDDAKKIGLKTYLVYRGLDDRLKYELYLTAKKRDAFLAKIHPFMYRDLNITEVPTLVFAKCPAKEFRYKKCDYLYKMIGDASLSYFFELAGEKGKDESMKEYWQKLNGTENE